MGSPIAQWILRRAGWKMDGAVPPHLKKYVMIMAPHTSMWDFVIGRLFFYALGINGRFLIKKELFFFPVGPLLRVLGSVPVNRAKGNNVMRQAIEMFKQEDELVILITPEGTRSKNPVWKKGFYHIAQKANVPIVPGYLDFKSKTAGIGPIFQPTDNMTQDIMRLNKFYSGKKGRHPEKFSLDTSVDKKS